MARRYGIEYQGPSYWPQASGWMVDRRAKFVGKFLEKGDGPGEVAHYDVWCTDVHCWLVAGPSIREWSIREVFKFAADCIEPYVVVAKILESRRTDMNKQTMTREQMIDQICVRIAGDKTWPGQYTDSAIRDVQKRAAEILDMARSTSIVEKTPIARLAEIVIRGRGREVVCGQHGTNSFVFDLPDARTAGNVRQMLRQCVGGILETTLNELRNRIKDRYPASFDRIEIVQEPLISEETISAWTKVGEQ